MSIFDQKDVDLILRVRHVIDLEEVEVSCPQNANVRELKEILAVQVERPELVEEAEMLRTLPDGSFAPLKDVNKVKSFRVIGIRGCPLHPPPPERPPPTLEDFDEFDPDEVITSPRSVQACHLEGILVGDLIYVPLSEYAHECAERRVAELWFEFFEALRQDYLAAARATRDSLEAAEDGRIVSLHEGHTEHHRIGAFGGHFHGVLEHSKYPMVQHFFREQSEMCDIERIYKGISKPVKKDALATVKLSRTVNFCDVDPVTVSNSADEAAAKLDDVLHGYKCTRDSHRFVEEQRLLTEANGVVQYAMNVKKLGRDQKELRRLVERRIETAEAQISNIDGGIQYRNDLRQGLDSRALASKPPKNKVERLRMPAIKKRAEDFAKRREEVHEKQMDDEYRRCDRMDELTLRDQAVEHRVHQHRSKTALAFARQWVLRRTRWQLNRNLESKDMAARANNIVTKQIAAAERVDNQKLITQKCTEYKREIAALRRLYADLAANREKMRADARRQAVAAEFSRLATEEAAPSPSHKRWKDVRAASTSSLGKLRNADVTTMPAKQSRIVKRDARFDFPTMAKGFFAASPSSSTTAPTTSRSINSPSFNNSVSSGFGDTSRIQKAASTPSFSEGGIRREVRYDV